MIWLSNISQIRMEDDPNPDLDECWLAATFTCARYSRPGCHLPSVRQARATAHNPDLPGPSGGSLTDIMEVCAAYFGDFGVREFHSIDWPQFVAYLDAGWVASLGVNSGQLPAPLRYGFMDKHEIAAQRVSGKSYICNPLAATGTAPRLITDAALKLAATEFIDGAIYAALFPPQEVSMIYIQENKTGEFVVPAHATPRAWKLEAGGFAPVKEWAAHSADSKAHFSAVLRRVGSDPSPAMNVMLKGSDGFFKDLYVAATSVRETYDSEPTNAEVVKLQAELGVVSTALATVTASLSAVKGNLTAALAKIEVAKKALT